ncbi:MAG: alpha-ketoglutarate-dependent dioxygenase AlkB [Acidimicrobiia bacterium]|nr:alpha-ketoglutarate-dependent dioxygenase AlkB [Acidimicrobiia bacterium]MBV8985790.1 alpha-ketoglutarate-dependent dioxygenase AlkB [Acidimicrobiia bacterium]
MSWQPSLLDEALEPAVDETFSSLERIDLDPESWVDYAPGWVSGADELFAELLTSVKWGQRTRRMFDKQVIEPRLTSSWRAAKGTPLDPPVLEDMRRLLSHRYGVELDSMGMNLYRDGRDSVAWHGDRIARAIEKPIVALVSLGHPRKFLLRPKGGGKSRPFELGRGDLLVTGGRTQRTWDHSVPKVANTAGPRLSLAFRHGMSAKVYD